MHSATIRNRTGVWVSYAMVFTDAACRAYDGPHAAKRMARALQSSVSACEKYRGRLRSMSLDAAITLARENAELRAELIGLLGGLHGQTDTAGRGPVDATARAHVGQVGGLGGPAAVKAPA